MTHKIIARDVLVANTLQELNHLTERRIADGWKIEGLPKEIVSTDAVTRKTKSVLRQAIVWYETL